MKFWDNPNTDPPDGEFPDTLHLELDHDSTLPSPGGDWSIVATMSLECKEHGIYEWHDLILYREDEEVTDDAAYDALGEACLEELEDRLYELSWR